jgi:hypothetical protein
LPTSKLLGSRGLPKDACPSACHWAPEIELVTTEMSRPADKLNFLFEVQLGVANAKRSSYLTIQCRRNSASAT